MKFKLLTLAKALINALQDGKVTVAEGEEICKAIADIFAKNKIALPASLKPKTKLAAPAKTKTK